MSFGWSEHALIALGLLGLHLTLACGVAALGLKVLGWRRRWPWMVATAALVLLPDLFAVQALTRSTLYGVAVMPTGEVRAYAGLLYVGSDVGVEPVVVTYGSKRTFPCDWRHGIPTGGRSVHIRLLPDEAAHVANSTRNAAFMRIFRANKLQLTTVRLDLDEASAAGERVLRARTIARLDPRWAGVAPPALQEGVLDRLVSLRHLVGDDGLSDPDRIVWNVIWLEMYVGGRNTSPHTTHANGDVRLDIAEAPGSYAAIGAHEMAACFEEAISLGALAPTSAGWGQKFQQTSRFDDLNTRMRHPSEPIPVLLDAYILEHQDEIGRLPAEFAAKFE